MNQTCKVCGEPAAGFHFGAFTCEGCKSFFGRSYNNLSSISECKNNGECIINKKNRTACKACRLRKCLMVGMSKSGSRYGRRSNWFKIHCLLQEQQQQAAAAAAAHHGSHHNSHKSPPPPPSPATLSMLGHPGIYPPGMYPPRTKEEFMMLGLEEYKHPMAASPSVSSPDSHNSDNSIDVNVRSNSLLRLGKPLDLPPLPPPHHLNKDLFLPLPFPGLGVMPPPAFLPPSHLLFPGYHPALYQHHGQGHPMMAASPTLSSSSNNNRYTPLSEKDSDRNSPSVTNNNNNNHITNGSKAAEELTKRFYLDAVLKRHCSSPVTTTTTATATTTTPISMAVITPNSESGAPRVDRRKSDDDAEITSDSGEDLVVSMTPPRSPEMLRRKPPAPGQEDPIDLSMKTGSSTTSSTDGSTIDDNRQLSGVESDVASDDDDDETTTTTTITTTIHKRTKYPTSKVCSDEEGDFDRHDMKRIKMQITTTPLDLTTRV